MILRKPYGFLIKYFKIIHLVITAILAYVVIKYRDIYIYMGKCIKNSVNKYDASSYINYQIFIYIILAGLLLFLVYWLLKYKDKPRRIYIVSIVGYLIIGIILFITFIYLREFNNNLIDQKTIRLYRDILFIGSLFQYYIIIVMIIRGLGFDIKKFNFSKDVQELNLSIEDTEEVEVNIGLNTTNIVREVRKQSREFGYFFREYKIYIIVIIIAIMMFLGYKGYNYFSNKYKVYQENEYVGEIKHLSIKESYYQINNDQNYIVIKFNTYTSGSKDKLNSGNIILDVNGNKYTVDKNVCYKFKSIGNCYKQQYINNNESQYILVYLVDKLNIDKSYVVYNESYDKSYRIGLKMKNIKGD